MSRLFLWSSSSSTVQTALTPKLALDADPLAAIADARGVTTSLNTMHSEAAGVIIENAPLREGATFETVYDGEAVRATAVLLTNANPHYAVRANGPSHRRPSRPEPPLLVYALDRSRAVALTKLSRLSPPCPRTSDAGRATATAMLILGLAAASCASTLPSAPPAPSAAKRSEASAPFATATAEPAASALEAKPPRPTPSAAPTALPAFDPELEQELGANGVEKLEVAASVCGAAVKREGKKLAVGCRACPPFDATSGPDGKVPVFPEGDSGGAFYPIDGLYRGSFTRSGIAEGAVVFSGCESHAENFGGTLLVGKAGEVWVVKSYRSGFHPSDCKPFPLPEGRMLLVCRWSTDHQGFEHELLDTYDFARGSDEDVEGAWGHVLAVDTDVFSQCLTGALTDSVNVGAIAEFHVGNARDGTPRLVVTVRSGGGQRTRAFNAKCAQIQQGIASDNPRRIDLRSVVPTTTSTLSYRWDGAAFVSDAAKPVAKPKP